MMDDGKTVPAEQTTQVEMQNPSRRGGEGAGANGRAGESAGANERAGTGPDRRQSVVDRRSGADRRQVSAEQSGYAGPQRRVSERRAGTGLERRRGPGRRRSDDRKAAEEGEMTGEQFEFVMAIETYKKVNKRMYPTWTEVLEVIRQLGYRKVTHRDIHLENCPEPELVKPKTDAA
jgi:hypothetical protein